MSQRKNRTRLWFALHGWTALPIWIFLLFVCVTGTLATVDREIMWLIDPAARASNSGGLERMPLNRLTEAVRRQLPGAHVVEIEFSEPYMALAVTIATPDQPEALAWVNPYDGRVQRVATGITFSHFIRSMHGWLLMQWFDGTPLGWYAVTAMGLPMLVSVITGLVVYKRFWRAITRPRLRLGQGSRLFWGDLHRLLAVWSLWFTVMIAVTGLWFMVRGLMWDMHVPLEVEAPDIPRREAPATRPAAGPDLDAALAMVQAASPGSKPRYVALPEHALGAVTVHSRSANPLLAEEAWVHPYDGTLLGLRDADLAPWHEAVSSVNASLHYGNFGGLWVKLIWTFFGILLSTLVASGTVIWFKRTARGPAIPEETP